MARKKKRFTEHDDGTYNSKSSIDNEPKLESDKEPETDEDGQSKMFADGESAEEVKEFLDGPPTERNFGIDLKLTLKPGGDGKAISIPLLAGEFAGSRIQELLGLAITSRRNKKIIEAALDLPDAVLQLNGNLNGHAGSFVSKSQPKEKGYDSDSVAEL